MHDAEAFLGILLRRRKRRLTVLLQYFRVARECKVILADHTWGLTAREPCGSTGQIVPRASNASCSTAGLSGRAATRTTHCSASSPHDQSPQGLNFTS